MKSALKPRRAQPQVQTVGASVALTGVNMKPDRRAAVIRRLIGFVDEVPAMPTITLTRDEVRALLGRQRKETST